MKKKVIVFFVLIVTLLCGCMGNRKEELEESAMTSTITINDFKFTLTAEKTIYAEKDLEEENAICYKLYAEYVGSEERVKIWHRSEMGGFYVENTKAPLYSVYIDDLLVNSFLEKDTPVLISEWTGSTMDLDKQKLSPGIYTVSGFISFSVGEDYGDKEHLENIECSLCLPFIIQ